jgi:uncharacterized protein (DUF305 family)
MRLALLGPLLLLAACQTEPAPDAHAGHTQPDHVQADADFMTGMIGHHAQAVAMSEMARANGASEEVLAIAQQIEAAQEREIEQMTAWLRARGLDEAAANHDGHTQHGLHAEQAAHAHGDMPGMLSSAQLERLEGAQGETFDRLFLQYMIEHHEGALVMVEDLRAAEGGGREAEIAALASAIEASQAVEIEQMEAMLAERGGSLPPL